MITHLVIPDCQIRAGDNTDFLHALGNFIVAKQPDTIINLGDFADMPSLSSYDVGRKSFEGRRYKADVEAVHEGNRVLFAPLKKYQSKTVLGHRKRYEPHKLITLGNHEDRINRAVNNDAKLDGTIGIVDLKYGDYYDEVYPFLQPVVVDGIAYCHFFTSGVLGRPATSAAAQLNKKHMSCIAGHQQGLQIATGHRADGIRLTSVIAGSFYEHNEDYLGPQGNKHWRGCLVLHEVQDGEFDLMPVSLKYLKANYL